MATALGLYAPSVASADQPIFCPDGSVVTDLAYCPITLGCEGPHAIVGENFYNFYIANITPDFAEFVRASVFNPDTSNMRIRMDYVDYYISSGDIFDGDRVLKASTDNQNNLYIKDKAGVRDYYLECMFSNILGHMKTPNETGYAEVEWACKKPQG